MKDAHIFIRSAFGGERVRVWRQRQAQRPQRLEGRGECLTIIGISERGKRGCQTSIVSPRKKIFELCLA